MEPDWRGQLGDNSFSASSGTGASRRHLCPRHSISPSPILVSFPLRPGSFNSVNIYHRQFAANDLAPRDIPCWLVQHASYTRQATGNVVDAARSQDRSVGVEKERKQRHAYLCENSNRTNISTNVLSVLSNELRVAWPAIAWKRTVSCRLQCFVSLT